MSTPAQRGPGRLATLGVPMLGLLAVEFLLGMALALYVVLPSGSPLTILASSPLLWVHILVGFLLIGITANAFRWTLHGAPRAAQLMTALGLVSAVGAFLAGMAFAFGDQSATASYAMSVGFVGVLVDAGYLLARGPQLAMNPLAPARVPAPSEG
jgi:hypothetical protein